MHGEHLDNLFITRVNQLSTCGDAALHRKHSEHAVSACMHDGVYPQCVCMCVCAEAYCIYFTRGIILGHSAERDLHPMSTFNAGSRVMFIECGERGTEAVCYMFDCRDQTRQFQLSKSHILSMPCIVKNIVENNRFCLCDPSQHKHVTILAPSLT